MQPIIDEYNRIFLKNLSIEGIQYKLGLILTEHKELSERLSKLERRRDLYTHELMRRQGCHTDE